MIMNYLKLMRFHKPIGIFLLLWPTLWALWLASNGKPDIKILVIFVLGTIVMRAAGCVINDIADRKFDHQVQRTRERPLTAGKISVRGAVICFVILGFLALVLVLQLNLYTICLSIIALLVAMLYPLMKRVMSAPQLVLGIAFSFGVPMVFAAQTNHVGWLAWYLFGLNFLWVVAYDTQYAMVDREDDLRIGIRSTAILFGQFDRLMVALFHGWFILGLFLLGDLLELPHVYYFAICVAAALCIYQQWLIRDRNPQKCFHAFLNNNWVGLIIFLGLVVVSS
ncbi:MAG: 4-hydroxybenzoate octaprenyltransferase [Gammaproteobacteria bacterium]|nr:4-hydroxybenzoate octaprenyltransferase [Gammaproteobacteria bacterium]